MRTPRSRVQVCRIDPWETEQEGWTTTYDVLQHYQKQLSETPGCEQAKVKLLCGADLLESFATPDLWSDEHVWREEGEGGGGARERMQGEGRMLVRGRKGSTWLPLIADQGYHWGVWSGGDISQWSQC